MVSEGHSFTSSKRSANANFSHSAIKRIFSDVAGDITIVVDGQSFVLHKFPLVSWSGKIRKMVADAKDAKVSKLELLNIPGGAQTFELAVKFCYGANFEISSSNVGYLRCAAEFLEMTEDYGQGNLIERTETYLTDVVVESLEKSIEVLASCEGLLPVAEEAGIVGRCVEAIALNATKEQLVSGLSGLECHGGPGEPKADSGEWWIEDLSSLRIDFYQQVIISMRKIGVRQDSITSSLLHYAHSSLNDVVKGRPWDLSRTKLEPRVVLESEQRLIMETLIGLLPADRDALVPLSFLFGMLRVATVVGSSDACRRELERRISFQLDLVSLDDLLIPSINSTDSFFDIDTVHRILVNFFNWIEEEDAEDSSLQYGYESEGLGASPSHSAVLKVGRLMDMYLAEIASDPYLKLEKFMAIIELLPDYARVVDDGPYRAIDIYLKAHPSLMEHECITLCKLINCQKLSQEASNHAAQNDRLPIQMTVRVLYFEQLRLKNALGGTSGDTFLSQRMSSGVPSAAMSPRDNYASLRRENRELKLEISRMRVRLSELEKEQVVMRQGLMGKSTNGKTFLGSLQKGFGRIGIFAAPSSGKRLKCVRGKGSEGKSGRRNSS
ncbi:BTB/POZ domain-containing protein At3g08570-like [Aristolochia californica]|uniref:BTB/POZ domain-containing protein At3g08570-like n=1 Tax=Aristolochia californica TaxID=171875 RepID=UPI0035D745BD